MLNIVMCDDVQEQREAIRGLLENYMNKASFSLLEEESGEKLLESLGEKRVDIALLDVEMGDINGIETGHKIRETNPDAVIIYISSHRSYAFDAFKVSAFQYLSKPVQAHEFKKVMDESLNRIKEIEYRNDQERRFLIERRTINVNLPYRDILYFEKSRHKVIIHSVNERFEIYASFKDIMERLNMECFVQCHQGYIVNVEKILGIRDRVITLKGTEATLPVSKPNVQVVKDALARKLFGS